MDKKALSEVAKTLVSLGYKITATGGTCDSLRRMGIEAEYVKKVEEGNLKKFFV